METMDAIYHRRSVRDYTSERLSKGIVRKLIDAAVQAPSAINLQPWSFLVIQNVETLRRYSQKTKNLMSASAESQQFPLELRKMLADPAFNIFYNASTLITIFAKPVGSHPDWDCCFAAQNLMLAAHEMGLATCPIGFAWPLFDQQEIRDELHIPEGYRVVLPIIAGYPNAEPRSVGRNQPEVLNWLEPEA